MKKKEKKAEEGAPAWMLTYGDMITLMLCFFVMLVSMSSIQQVKFEAAMGSFRKHLGFLPKHLKIFNIFKNKNIAPRINMESFKAGVHGKEVEVMSVREGTKIILGGKLLFAPGSAEIRKEAIPILTKLADVIRGYKNKIEIRGHTSSAPLLPGSPYRDNWELSWWRAMNVAYFLIEKGNINPRRIRVTACNAYDPADSNLFADGQARNRRVEVIVSDEYVKPQSRFDLKERKERESFFMR